MDRVIKFRVFDSYKKEMVRVGVDSNASFNSDGTISTHGILGANPLMQFTGMVDKHGVEIYEGDIVRCFLNGKPIGNIDKIEFKNGAFILAYRTVTLHEWNTMPDDTYTGELEVVGNTLQNPNLIK